MSNSPLVSYTKISPNKTKRAYRNSSSTGKISKITIHHMAGCISVESCGSWFAQSSAKCSSNYGIDSTGKIALYVPEDYRSWCSSNGDNDNIAVTIEVANSKSGGNWPVSDKALAACIDLCVDICKRNGIARLNYTGTKAGNLTRHDMFCNKVCPGPYLGGKFPYIVQQVNNRLANGGEITALTEKPTLSYEDDNYYVSKAQELLMKLGYDLGVSKPTGYFGKNTLAAVKKFQADNGIEQTGNIGKKTWAALFLKTMDISASTEKPDIRYNDENVYVFKCQGLLMELGYSIGVSAPTGYFGNNTLSAVKKFQIENQLEADGVVGKLTWAAIFAAVEAKQKEKEQAATEAPLETSEFPLWLDGGEATTTTVTPIVEEEPAKPVQTGPTKCTAEQAVEAMKYWLGYYEKASSSYASTRAKSAFEKNKGSANYTYPGYLCGVQGQPWCAATVSTAIYEACGSNKALAKEVMYGVWPYVSCNQVWDASGSKCYWSYYQRWTLGKGERKTYYPKAGDIIIFTDDKKTRSHTGMVYACDDTYVYTIEGNSGNMCRKRSYVLTSSYIFGWVRPNYATSTTTTPTTVTKTEQYGKEVEDLVHVLSKGTAGAEVKTLQILLNGKNKAGLTVDGDFGPYTEAAGENYQGVKGLTKTGIVDAQTWKKLLTE